MSTPDRQALLKKLLAQKGLSRASGDEPALAPRGTNEAAVLSFAQERLWFVQQLNPRNTAYHLGQSFALHGPLDVAALRAALGEVLGRHEALRCAFPERDGRGACVVLSPVELGGEALLAVTDCSDRAGSARAAAVAVIEREVLETPFDVTRPPLLRAHLMKLAAHEHRLIFCVHHLVFDGWSIGVLARELREAYARNRVFEVGPDLRAGRPAANTLEVSKSSSTGSGDSPSRHSAADGDRDDRRYLQYADYAAWQRRRVTTAAWRDSLAYWTRRLAGVPMLLLPTDRRRPEAHSGRGAGHRFALPAELVQRLRALGQAEDATLFATLLAAWQVMLARYAGQTDFAVGSPVANRPRAELEGLIGFFVNMIALRADVGGDPTFRALLRRTGQAMREALAHQEIPFEQVVEQLKVPRDLAYHPVFQVGFTLQNTPAEPLRLASVEWRPIEPVVTAAKFDVLLALEEASDGGLHALFEYSTDLFEASTMRLMAENFLTLLQGIVAAPHTPVSRLPLVSEAEFALWPQPAAPREPAAREHEDDTLITWFAATVKRFPDRAAVTDGTTMLTYAELDRRAEALAAELRAAGVGPDRLVAIAMERSAALMVAMLGVLKAGGAYLPIDPAYPRERQAFMLEDAAAKIVLVDAAMRERVPDVAGVVEWTLHGDGRWQMGDGLELGPSLQAGGGRAQAVRSESGPYPRNKALPDNCAYVIYTSGSTGKPKGVPVTHRNVVRLFTQTQPWFGFGAEDVWPMFHSFAFDFSVWEIWGALLYGGRLVIVPFEVSRATDQFHALLVRERVTVLNQTPSAFRQLVQHDTAQPEATSFALRWVVFGGEALDLQTLAPWFARHGDRRPRLVNMYGITETTVHVTYREITADDVAAAPGSVIGEPIPDLTLHLLDAHLQPVPRGVAGEIFVGGAGLARGYLNRPELTAERFVAHPFTGGGRLYRSGDSGRRLANGDLEYLGRIDFQVKVRGFRIELGEIESALGRHPGIAGAAVLAQRDGSTGESRLAAWLVKRGARELSVDELRKHLLAFLPDYMVPASFTFVERLPLTTNGKVDRAALPALAGRRAEAEAEFVAPATDAERLLALVLQQVLRLPQVGATDNFFALGGDSIRSIEVRAAARARGWDFQLQDLFRHQTVRELARVLQPVATADARQADAAAFALVRTDDRAKLPREIVDAYPLAALQAGMVFHSDLHPESAVYLDLFSFHLRAAWNEPALRAALDTVMSRHAVLRTSFEPQGFSEPLQLVHARLPLPLAIEDLTSLEPEEQEPALDSWFEDEKARRFAWTQPPLWRVVVHRRSAETWQFTLVVHHAILDGWSVSALLAEIFGRYLDRLAGRTAVPAIAPPAFREYVELERAALASAETKAFWAAQLDEPPVAQLPRRPSRVQPEVPQQSAVFVRVPPEQVRALVALASRAGVALKHVLLAAHAKVVGFLAAQPEVLTGVISNGRPETTGAAETLGLFLNTVPYRLPLRGDTWLELVRAAFVADGAVLPHRRYPLAELQKAHGRAALFDTAFNYVHFHVLDALRARGDLALLGARYFDQNTFALFAQFTANPDAGELQLELRYDMAEFTPEQVTEFAAVYERVLGAMAGNPEARHEHASLLGVAEWKRIVEDLNAEPLPPDAPRLLHDGFFAAAARTPAAIALIDGARRMTYAEVAQRVRAWAEMLREGRSEMGDGRRKAGNRRPDAGDRAEGLIGVCVGRSAELVMALLAVLESGAAYVPLDPNYPADRLAFMGEDARIDVLVTERALVGRVPVAAGTRVVLVEDLGEMGDRRSEMNEIPKVGPDLRAGRGDRGRSPLPDEPRTTQPENLAYLIYTSGSTGRPKATAIEHRNATALIAWARASFPADELAGVLFSTSVCFDLSIFEIFVTLAAGGKVIVAENALALPELPARDEVTLINTVPSAAAELVRQRAIPAGVRVVNLAGEPLSASLADQLYASGTVKHVYDLYGPSEDTTYSTWGRREAGGPETIGRVLPGSQLYLLDDHLMPVPFGAVGEIFLGGAGVARGYLGRSELTAERFLPDPFAVTPGARCYRTGDLARYLPDGRLQFLGRRDHQVKIRGFRIELGEIKAVLEKHPQVTEAAVIAHEQAGGAKRLVAYLAGPDLPVGRALDGELRAYLGARLPEYFVPSVFVRLPRLPLTPNRKLDRKALPAPESAGGTPAEMAEIVAPQNERERALARIWSDVLKAPRVGVHDNYFALGGDSILVLQVVARAREAGLALTPRLVFERPTIAELADAAGVAGGSSGAAAQTRDHVTVETSPALLPIQRWFFAQGFAEPQHWNQSALFTAREPIDVARLERAWRSVVAHHEVFRWRFRRTEAGEWTVGLANEAALGWRTATFAAAQDITAVCTEEQAKLDLAHGPLIRAVWFESTRGEPAKLFVVIHHLVVDGVSWRVLLADVLSAYRTLASGAEPRMEAAPVSVGRWARELSAMLARGAFDPEAAHWRALAHVPRTLLPVDDPAAENVVADDAMHTEELTVEETETLLRRAVGQLGGQINEVLLAALALALREWTGATTHVVHLEGHGREAEELGLDLSRTVGWLTSLFPVRLDAPADAERRAVVSGIRAQLAAEPRRGLGYGVGRWLAEPPRWEVPSAEICFNYLGQFDGLVGEGPFGPAEEYTGLNCSPRSRRPHALEVVAIVVGAQLRIDWRYSARRHRAATIAGVARRYVDELRALLVEAEKPATPQFDLAPGSRAEIEGAIEEIQF